MYIFSPQARLEDDYKGGTKGFIMELLEARFPRNLVKILEVCVCRCVHVCTRMCVCACVRM